MINKGQWIILPYSAVQHLPGLRISPPGVIPQQGRCTRWIVDYPLAATEAMKQRPDAWDFLEKTALPFLFILGDEDALIPHEAILRGLEGKAKHKCVILNHVGHQGTYEAPNACFQAMANFI